MAAPPENIERTPAVGLVYDERMCRHSTPYGESHPENPERLRSIWRKLQTEGITERCVVMKAKETEDKYIEPVHSQSHIKLMKNISSKAFDSRRDKIARMFNSIYFNKGSSESAYLAAGSTIEITEKVAKGELDSGIALVRPPGHHAEHNEAMGFCLFNNVAIAASYLLDERSDLGIKKILIVDWDVHHGNGTQKMYYKDPRVLYFSVHRYDFGSFYPGGEDGYYCMIGEGEGQGYNINVPWEHGKCGDADYTAVWDHILIPVAQSFNPDIILISAGFDAALGDPLGGCCITPQGYTCLLEKLTGFANGKIVLVLEGGYNLNSIANSVLACAKVLLGDKTPFRSLQTKPFESTWRIIQAVREELKTYWPVLADAIPESLLKACRKPLTSELYYDYDSESDSEECKDPSGEISSINAIETASDDVSMSLSNLSINEAATSNQISDSCIKWRSDLSKVYIWYASYGSNMWGPRFLCYIAGGKVEGMSTPCCGSRDTTPPEDTVWKIVPHKLFFGRSFTPRWGNGGVAFLHPESNNSVKAHLCMYKITLEQFNDLLFQENRDLLFQENRIAEDSTTIQRIESPLLDLSGLYLLSKNVSLQIEALKGGWYSNVLYLGTEDNLPILTITCPPSDITQFKSGVLPLCPPSKDYANTLIKGLVEGKRLGTSEALDYISTAANGGL